MDDGLVPPHTKRSCLQEVVSKHPQYGAAVLPEQPQYGAVVTPEQSQYGAVVLLKRPQYEVAVPPARPQYGVTQCVLRRSKQLLEFLNVTEVLRAQITPVLTFLTAQEADKLQEDHIPPKKAVTQLLLFVKSREGNSQDDACRKLVACILHTEGEHRGHKDLKKIFHGKLPPDEWLYIKDLVCEVEDSPMPSPYRTPQPKESESTAIIASVGAPEHPIEFIRLQGQLEECATIEADMWRHFSIGDYDTLERTVLGVKRDRQLGTDYKIVAMWFNSLITMHREGTYYTAIGQLDQALMLCKQENCVNRTILEGRIHQRMAQNYLMMGEKEPATEHFEMAKDCLQMVGRGYDKANMFCREAKIMSAVEPDKRKEIEGMYNSALRALEKEDAYFLASFPSVTLSKAAFHLKVSFGSKASQVHSAPFIDPSDIKKAKETLNTIDKKEHILLEMRKCEYAFLRAELCRLEGNEEEASQLFRTLMSTPGSSKVKNIQSLAAQRLQCMETARS